MNCSQLYLGVDKPIDEMQTELFSVTLVPSEADDAKAIRRILKRQYVYYLAPHSRCGCGWEYLDIGSDYDNLSKSSVEALEHFLRGIESTHKDSKLYSVCSNAVGVSPLKDMPIASAEFMACIDELRVAYGSPGANVYVLNAHGSTGIAKMSHRQPITPSAPMPSDTETV